MDAVTALRRAPRPAGPRGRRPGARRALARRAAPARSATPPAFSFYPSKNLGALGDGGAICTDDAAIADRAPAAAQPRPGAQGRARRASGFNERLDGLQAALLRVKLRPLDDWNAARRALAGAYRDGLCRRAAGRWPSDAARRVRLPPVPGPGRTTATRSASALGRGRASAPASTTGRRVHRQPPFAELPSRRWSRSPTPRRWSEEELSLPMFPELSRSRGAAACAECPATTRSRRRR